MRDDRLMVFRLALLVVFLFVGSAQGRTWRVEQDGSGEFVTIQPAVDAAADGDTILIGAGWYQETNEYTNVPNMYGIVLATAFWNDGRDLAIIGIGKESVVIGPPVYSDTGTFGVIAVNSSVSVRGVSFDKCRSGIRVVGNVNVDECHFSESYVGVYIKGTTGAEIINCVFVNANNSDYGVIVRSSLNVNINSCEFDDAGIYMEGTSGFFVEGSQFINSSYMFAPGSGGEVANCEFVGGHFSVDGGHTVIIRDSEFSGGSVNLSVSERNTVALLYDNIFVGGEYYGLSLSGSASVIAEGNHFLLGESIYFVMTEYYPSYPYNIDLRNNYWGTSDAVEIEAMIFDSNDSTTELAVVQYFPFSGVPLPSEPTSWGDLKAMYRE